MKRGPNPVKIRQWTRRLQQFQKSRLSVTDFCRRARISTASFYRWRTILSDRPGQDVAVRAAGAGSNGRGSKRQLAGVASSSSPLFRPVRVTAAGPACLTVRLPGGTELAISDHLPVVDLVIGRLLAHASSTVEGPVC